MTFKVRYVPPGGSNRSLTLAFPWHDSGSSALTNYSLVLATIGKPAVVPCLSGAETIAQLAEEQSVGATARKDLRPWPFGVGDNGE